MTSTLSRMSMNTFGGRPGSAHAHGNTIHARGATIFSDDWDPLAIATLPPANESQSQRVKRVKEESHAKAVSEAIDEDINRARHARKKKMVQLLLLGQSESGKSTLLKNFQLLYTPKQFGDERESWRSIIYLNVLRSVRLILEAIKDAEQHHQQQQQATPPPTARLHHQSSASPVNPTHRGESQNRLSRTSQSSISCPIISHVFHHSASSSLATALQTTALTSPAQLTPEHKQLFERLSSLLVLELSLLARMSAKGETEATTRSASTGKGLHELAVLASSKWKEVRMLIGNGSSPPKGNGIFPEMGENTISSPRSMTLSLSSGSGAGSPPSYTSGGRKPSEDEIYKRERAEENRVSSALRELAEDIEALWTDPIIRGLPAVKKLWLEEHPGFFLDQLERITARPYVPSDDDVLKARVKTLGVTEYNFSLKHRYPEYRDWKVFDVGGTRCQREYWVPYFDDMDAIIFLAPISCFDQTLAEDSTTNRLQDSMELWTSLCKNKLLSSCHIVLFLNKCDILEKKLNSGISFSKFVKTYSDQKSNDPESVRQYLKRKFEAMQKHYSPVNRPFYCHFTSLTNRSTTNNMLESVTDMVIRQSLSTSTIF